MDSYINSQLDFANRMSALKNFGQNDVFALTAQRMQEFRNIILEKSVQVITEELTNIYGR